MPRARPDTVYRPQPTVLSTTLDEETILLDLETGSYFGLNETGARIWTLLDGRRDTQTVSSLVANEFDIDPEAADRETRTFLGRLGLLKLIAPV